MRENIDRDAAPDIGEPLDQPVPEMTVEENAMNKDHGGSRAGFPIGDIPELGRNIFVFILGRRLFCRHFHVSLLWLVGRESVCPHPLAGWSRTSAAIAKARPMASMA